MNKEQVNYGEWAYHPTNDILISPAILGEVQKFVNAVKIRHTEFKFPQQTTWFHKETHQPIDNTKKLSEEQLNKDYYKNINIVSTEKKGNAVFDELSLSAIKLFAAFEDVFRHNVDKGNAIPREPAPNTQNAPQTEVVASEPETEVVSSTSDTEVVAGPTLVTDES